MYPVNNIPSKLKGFTISVTLLLSLLSFSGLGNVQESRSANSTKVELHERAEKVTKRTVRYQAIKPVSSQLSFDFTYRTFSLSQHLAVQLKQNNRHYFTTDHRSGMQTYLKQSHPQSPDSDLIKA